MRALVTGAAGLVGSSMVRLLSKQGFELITVDNYLRGQIFGPEGDTRPTMDALRKEARVDHHVMDVRDPKVGELVEGVDLVVHTAAQPSHPRSIEIPVEDFEINARATLLLLEAVRRRAPQAVFVYCSTNKVYGDVPNSFTYERVGRRYTPVDPTLRNGFDEGLRIDQCLHTPFGVSKAAADLYVQEFGRLYGLRTGVFRMGCITGGAAMAVEQHNWEPYFVRKALNGERLTIFGYEGYQVRDVIHADDLSRLFLEFFRHPHPGEVYNAGGGPTNSTSLLEAIELIEGIVGRKMLVDHGPAREGDHMWYVSNLAKAQRHHPGWGITIGLPEIFRGIYQAQMGRPVAAPPHGSAR
ncbi:MAG: NAD-dependent epimerase/dehydratase family protein [Euryarchaeota archaeon]|nr:NAD-dependent epimerase/dehydratase family protein [Euryarchaeota archaeon]MDE1836400.1 NAD-dependent epimerase/dehydratase family protein [Euryarchaeota archaeon]MDE1881679.1 NAD-dependent epimerase/dehydratase family protein [Euryarchaeota archaeon]MDE2044148.1 NAD-dependent epimerase/dehydratase family protein [Thermoplasmata archaeon]